MASLKDIARECGVSVRTVGRVLNNSANVNEQTRSRVRAVIDQLGYRVDKTARALRTGRSHFVLVVMESGDELDMRKLAAMQQSLDLNGYGTAVLFGGFSRERLQAMLGDRPAGVVFLRCLPDLTSLDVDLAKLPLVYVDCNAASGGCSVFIDRRQGVCDAVKFLAGKGHARIAYAGPDDPGRVDGFRRGIRDLGMDEILVFTDSSDADQWNAGRASLPRLLDHPARPTAVQVYSDVMALGVIAAAHECAVRIPEDLAVVGFDDRSMAKYSSPRLTTIAQPNEKVGRAAAEMLLRQIRSPEFWNSLTVAPELIERDST